MPTPAKPYLTTTPWAGFTAQERKRTTPLLRCPSKACFRAKACIDAYDKLFCQRSHESLGEARARKGMKPVKTSTRLMSLEEAQAKRMNIRVLLTEAEAQGRAMTERWKAGEFDGVYGKYKPGGILKYPPMRIFVG